MRIVVSVALVSTLGLSAIGLVGCASSNKEAKTSGKSLYDRLGGKPAIVAVVDDFVANCAADQVINARFANTDIPKFKALLVDQICEAAGGPCKYAGKDMKTAHTGMKITDEEFTALVGDLQKSLNKFKVTADAQKDLIGALAPMKPDIVGH